MDGLDPRQGAVPTEEYTEILDADPANLTIGVLKEGFGHDESEAGVDETVDEALKAFADVGADLRQVSVPMHRDGLAIWNGIATRRRPRRSPAKESATSEMATTTPN